LHVLDDDSTRTQAANSARNDLDQKVAPVFAPNVWIRPEAASTLR
jgi:hypothetical protein